MTGIHRCAANDQELLQEKNEMKLSVIKMLALGFALTVTAPWIASAADEGGKGGGHGRGEWLQAALDKLNLNDDQKAKIKDIAKDTVAPLRDELKDLSPEKRREKLKELRETAQKFVKGQVDELSGRAHEVADAVGRG